MSSGWVPCLEQLVQGAGGDAVAPSHQLGLCGFACCGRAKDERPEWAWLACKLPQPLLHCSCRRSFLQANAIGSLLGAYFHVRPAAQMLNARGARLSVSSTLPAQYSLLHLLGVHLMVIDRTSRIRNLMMPCKERLVVQTLQHSPTLPQRTLVSKCCDPDDS